MNTLEQIYRTLADYNNRLADIEAGRPLDEQVARNRASPYSVSRVIGALQEGALWRDAPREAEESQRIAERLGREPSPGCVFVPVSQRNLEAGVAGAGGYLVSQQVAPGDIFVGALRAASFIEEFGVSMLPVVGNPSIPRITAGTSSGWLSSESASITESQPTIAAAVATPKPVGTYCEIPRQVFRQITPAGERFVLTELARSVAEAFNVAIIAGTGASGQPTGITNTPGIGSQAGASLAHSGVLNTIGLVEAANALVSRQSAGWVVAPDAAQVVRGRERAAGSGFLMDNGAVGGFRAVVTKAVPNGTMLFGDWSGVVLPTWGVLEVGTDPYGVNSALFTKGLTGVRALWSVDVIVLRPASFAVITSVS